MALEHLSVARHVILESFTVDKFLQQKSETLKDNETVANGKSESKETLVFR